MLLKTSKRYVINTNRVNNQGFRMLSEGIDLSAYDNNPVMLWMHYRSSGFTKNEVLPVGVVKEFQLDDNGVLTGQPYFDGTDSFAKSLYDKYENGTLNMFSPCAQPLEISAEPEDMLSGQTGPTVTKALMKEVSACDIGGNPDAYGVQLCDEENKLIKLSDLPINKNSNMKLTNISAASVLPLIKLSDDATEAKVIEAITALIQLAEKNEKEVIRLTDVNRQSEENVTKLQKQLEDLQKESQNAKVVALTDKAVVDRKITPAQKEIYVKLAEKDFANTEMLLNSMPANPSIKDSLTIKDGEKSELVKLSEMSFDDLHKSNKLVRLKELDAETFNAKFKEKYGKEPKN